MSARDEQPATTLVHASDSAPTGPAPDEPAPIDAAPIDAAPIDAAPIDAAPIDAAPIDAAPIDAPPLAAGTTGCPELALLLDRLTAERYRPVPPPPGRYRERPVADSGALHGAEAVGHDAVSAQPEGGADGG
jgi:ribonuclease E